MPRSLSEMRLYVLLTSSASRRPLLEAARAALAGGADALQLREKDAPDRQLLDLGAELRRLTESMGALFFVNDRPDVARLVAADGVHVGQDDLPLAAARSAMGGRGWAGVSTHSVEQALAARGADYIGVGPVYPTETKGYAQGKGTGLVARVRAATALPIVAIGGITAETAAEVLQAGATAVAVCSAVIGREDVEAAARAFREKIDGFEDLRI